MKKTELQSWNNAITFVNDVYALTSHFPVGESEILRNRIRKASISLSVALNNLNTEYSKEYAPGNFYPVLSYISLLETYILIAGEHFINRDIKLLYQKLHSLKTKIENLNIHQAVDF